MSVCFLGDLHFDGSNHNKELFWNQMEFFTEQFFPYVKLINGKHVVIAGDTFDSRAVVDIYILQELREKFFKWFADNKVTLHISVGNHDTYRKDSNHHNVFTATGIDTLPCVKVYHEVTDVVIENKTFCFVPWQPEGQVFLINKKADVVVGHFPVVGFPMTKGISCKDGFDINSFKEYPLVVSGHFHIAQQKGNFQMLGNPYQKDWGDFEEVKGFWVLQDYGLVLMENGISPKHIKIFYKEEEDKIVLTTKGLGYNDLVCTDKDKDVYQYMLKLCEKNHIRFVLLSKKNQKKIDKIYNDMLHSSLGSNKIEMVDAVDVVESCDFSNMEKEIKEDSDVIGNMQLFTESLTLTPELDKEKLTMLFDI
jgi:DNA repair exonuclease SbcCD nuclease subunit